MLRNRSTIALLTAELISTTGIQMTFVALPWFVLVSWRNPEFVHFFVVDQHLARYLWTHEHGEPIWFYLPLIPVSLGPWTLMLVFDPPLVRAALAPRTWTVPTRFLVIWTAAIIVFFAWLLFPMLRIAWGLGPMNLILHCSQISAK